MQRIRGNPLQGPLERKTMKQKVLALPEK